MRELNFFEAMKAADEGKVVVDSTGNKCKKADGGGLLWWDSDGKAWTKPVDSINHPWTIEEPEPKLLELPGKLWHGKLDPLDKLLAKKAINNLIDFAADLQKQIKELKGERK